MFISNQSSTITVKQLSNYRKFSSKNENRLTREEERNRTVRIVDEFLRQCHRNALSENEIENENPRNGFA